MINFTPTELKEFALAQLGQNKWGEAIGVTFVYFVIISVSGIIPFGSVLVGGPLSLGLYTYFLNLSRNNFSSFNTLFEGFQNLEKHL